MKPVVSVVIPTRNRAERLPRALDSIFAQRGLGAQFDVEVVVVDDASSDATPSVVQRYPQVRYIRLAERRGDEGATNEGIRSSTGRYLATGSDITTKAWGPVGTMISRCA